STCFLTGGERVSVEFFWTAFWTRRDGAGIRESSFRLTKTTSVRIGFIAAAASYLLDAPESMTPAIAFASGFAASTNQDLADLKGMHYLITAVAGQGVERPLGDGGGRPDNRSPCPVCASRALPVRMRSVRSQRRGSI